MPTPAVTNGALLQCSFGVAPSSLIVLPENRVSAVNMPAATIEDNKPLLNILPFGMCMSESNPEVVALTAAAMGVFTPAPCIPVTTEPWAPGTPTVTIAGIPAVDTNCKLMCEWGGIIGIVTPSQMTVTVP